MKKLFIILAFVTLFAPLFTLAEGDLSNAMPNLEASAGPAGVTDKSDLANIIGTGINVALSLVGLIFLILMVYAGYLWMTAQGDEEKTKTAQKIITAAIIGLVVVLSAYAITFLVTSRLAAQ